MRRVPATDGEISLRQARSPADVETARALFLEYAKSLDFELCFQSFDAELAGLPGDYAEPNGRLLLADADGETQGCVALHRYAEGVCEMKRLYVRPQARGRGVGRLLVEALIDDARKIGYRSMRLDTIGASMQTAVALYRTLGFKEIAPYRENPIATATYLELTLR
ncbi:MAG TPA: GNAT family N-acetyltransferase [Myxococcales bacterium]|jgi:ribosomal protein S18 acetylase RimI-like enzyme